MFYDLNVPWTPNDSELPVTLSFLVELGYNTVALNHTISGKLPSDLTCPIPNPLPFNVPASLRVLRRCTIIISDPSQNYRLSSLASNYDIVALRPTTEKSLQQASNSLDCDLISLDMSSRFQFYFKFSTLKSAIERGVRLEICYAEGIQSLDNSARRNLLSNSTQLIRATRSRGIIISSEAKTALACRGPWDVINLAAVWGLGQERGREAVGNEARQVVMQATMKRTSYRGVVDVVYGGEKPKETASSTKGKGLERKKVVGTGQKRNMDVANGDEQAPGEAEKISKREMKRRAKKAKLENTVGQNESPPQRGKP
ncbi:MAG: hypothetical protein M1834_004618 [Cirrosporium novae-zelandiae]|nr:MAG: hypothetical protein M1834_004618 [Cirrosporium novae-zelandiae]